MKFLSSVLIVFGIGLIIGSMAGAQFLMGYGAAMVVIGLIETGELLKTRKMEKKGVVK